MTIRVLSLGAGVQSSALALMCAKGEIEPVDCAIFADTQAEPKAVYEWLDYLETQLPFPVHRVTVGDLAEASTRERVSKTTGLRYLKHMVPAFIKYESGKRDGMLQRQCTLNFKITPIERKLREISKKAPVEQLIGISSDEAIRAKPSKLSYVTNCFPLLDLRFSRSDCLAWMERSGCPIPPRSSCVFCPYHSDKEWTRLNKEEFQEACRYEKTLQEAYAKVERFDGMPFLHSSRVPLSEVKFNRSDERSHFGNECEGMCGV